MFRLNLYSEARQKRRARRARVTSTFVTGMLSGLILLAAFFHGVTGGLLAERTQSLRTQTAQWQSKTAALKARAGTESIGSLEAKLLKRAGRIVWSPKLAELGREVPDAVLIDRIAVGATSRGSNEPEFFVQGRIPTRAGRDEVAIAAGFLDHLKASPVMSSGLLGLELASVREDVQKTEEVETRETVFRIISLYEEAAP